MSHIRFLMFVFLGMAAEAGLKAAVFKYDSILCFSFSMNPSILTEERPLQAVFLLLHRSHFSLLVLFKCTLTLKMRHIKRQVLTSESSRELLFTGSPCEVRAMVTGERSAGFFWAYFSFPQTSL